MGNAFHSLFSIVRLSPARRIVIFQRMLVIATTLGLTRLLEHLTGALAHEVKNLVSRGTRWNGRWTGKQPVFTMLGGTARGSKG
jgi:hypothetical protein